MQVEHGEKTPLQHLVKSNVFYLDGAVGSYFLVEHNLDARSIARTPVTYKLELRTLQRGFAEAGSQIILAATFSLNSLQLEMLGLTPHFEELNRAALEITKNLPNQPYVLGSIGPTAHFKASHNDKVDAIVNQAQILINNKASGLFFETNTTLADLETIKEAVARLRMSHNPFIGISVSPKATGELFDGASFHSWTRLIDQIPAHMVGLNCMEGPASGLGILARWKAHEKRPLFYKPSAGIPKKTGKKWTYPIDSEGFSAQMKKALEYGATGLGGCCGVTPKFIRDLKQSIQNGS